MFSQGSYVRVSTSGHAGVITPDDLARQVTSYLESLGTVNVAKNTVGPTRDLVSDILQGNLLSYDYIADTTVKTLYDFDTESDADDQVLQSIKDAFGYVTGFDVTGAFVVGKNDQNAPALPVPENGVLANLRQQLGIDNVLTNVNSDVRLALWGILAIVLIVATLIAFGPNVPKLVPVIRA